VAASVALLIVWVGYRGGSPTAVQA